MLTQELKLELPLEVFLLEIQQMEKKNLALEALKRLLNDEIHSRTHTNVTEEKKFSERYEDNTPKIPPSKITNR